MNCSSPSERLLQGLALHVIRRRLRVVQRRALQPETRAETSVRNRDESSRRRQRMLRATASNRRFSGRSAKNWTRGLGMGSASICRQWVGHVIEDRDHCTPLQRNHDPGQRMAPPFVQLTALDRKR